MVYGSVSCGIDISRFLLTYMVQGYKVRSGDKRTIDSIRNIAATYSSSDVTDYCIMQYVPCARHANKPDIAPRSDLSLHVSIVSVGSDGKQAAEIRNIVLTGPRADALCGVQPPKVSARW